MEQTVKRELIHDAGICKGHVDTVADTEEGYQVYEAYTCTPPGNDNEYLGRFHTRRDAEYAAIQAYARDRKCY